MRHLTPILLIALFSGCSYSPEPKADNHPEPIMGFRERVLKKRTKFLLETQYLPKKTPYDAKPGLRELYLSTYRATFLLATHPDSNIPFEVYPVMETDADRVAHYAWLAGRSAGWDQLGIWSKEVKIDIDEDIRAWIRQEESRKSGQ